MYKKGRGARKVDAGKDGEDGDKKVSSGCYG